MLPLAIVTAVAMLVAWFPLSSLWHQQSVLNATTAQINVLQRQERALALQAKSISTAASSTRLARQQYQLVAPGQSLIQVLPGGVAGGVTQGSGDPGLQPLVSPSSASSLLGVVPASAAPRRAPSGFLARLVRTLEFWR